MEIFEQLVSILSGAVGLGAGAAAMFKRKKSEPALPSATAAEAAPVSVSSFHDPTGVAANRQPRGLAKAFYVGAAAFLVPVPFAALDADPFIFAWLALAAVYYRSARAAGREHSSTYRSASMSVAENRDAVFQRSLAVLKGLGLRIVSFDAEAGLIEARGGRSIRSSGQRVSVLCDPAVDGGTRVHVDSDSLWTTVWVDFGANQRNVDRFLAGLTG